MIVEKLKTFSYIRVFFSDIKHFRSSRPEVFCKKGALNNFAKLTGKHLCQSLFFNNVAGLRHRLMYLSGCICICENFISECICEILKNTYFYRTPLVAVSGILLKYQCQKKFQVLHYAKYFKFITKYERSHMQKRKLKNTNKRAIKTILRLQEKN